MAKAAATAKPKSSAKNAPVAGQQVKPFTIGGYFVMYCVERGWLTMEKGKDCYHYFLTEAGVTELPKFGVKF